jgi:UDP-N-acetylmuramoylalanine--D-glutamate ligase
MSKLAKGRVVWFSKKLFAGDGAFIRNGQIIFRDAKKEETVAMVKDIRYLSGEHNLENVLAAVCAAKTVGVSNASIAKALKRFRGLPDRQELIRERRGVKYINDTTATSPDGVVAALKTLGGAQKNKIVLIAGGKDKGLDYREMSKLIRSRVKTIILFDGTGTQKLLLELGRAGFDYDRAPIVKDMATAVKLAANEAESGDIVLLSPGCASFGLFQNEFDRGAKFVKAVRSL